MAEKWVLYYHNKNEGNSQIYKCKLPKKCFFQVNEKQKTASEVYFIGLPDDNINQVINGNMEPLSKNGLIIQTKEVKELEHLSGDKQFYAIDSNQSNKLSVFKKAVTYGPKYTNLLKIEGYLDKMIEAHKDYSNASNNSKKQQDTAAESWLDNLAGIKLIQNIGHKDMAYEFQQQFLELSGAIEGQDLKVTHNTSIFKQIRDALCLKTSLYWWPFGGNRKRVREKAMTVVEYLIKEKNFCEAILKQAKNNFDIIRRAAL